MNLHTLKQEQFFDAPIGDVFPFFATPENLEQITPEALGMQILTPSPIHMRDGALFDYIVRIHGFPMRWTTFISCYEPPYKFVDVQLRGPYGYWHHTHTFHEQDGGTLMHDEVRYAMPFGPLGELVHRLWVQKELQQIFAHRKEILAKHFSLPHPA